MHPGLLILLILLAPGLGQAGGAERGPLQLSLKRAVELALSPEGNTYIQLSDESLRQAKSRTTEARSLLLPDIEAQASQTTAMKSLAALGLDLASSETLLGAANSLTGPLAATEKQLLFDIVDKIPRVVGPFNSVDIRARLTEDMLDFSNIRRYQSSRAAFRAARNDRSATDNSISAAVAKAYLAALRANADVEAYEANVSLAEAVLKQSENQKAAGTGTGIEVTRSKVQLSNEKQHLLVVQNERTKAYLQLLRVMGLNLATELELTDKLSYEPAESMTVEQAQALALKNRPDVKAQADRQDAARLSAHAVKLERTPSLVAFADYGTTGTNGATVTLLPTRDYGFAMRVPIFDGGRRDARRAESASQFRQERVRTNDLHEQVELDVRMALDSLRSADAQVKVAEAGLSLAQSELTQARRRYEAGVASSLEVTDAQTRLERARDNRIAALFNHNVARVDVGQATGTIAEVIAHEPAGDPGGPVMTTPKTAESEDELPTVAQENLPGLSGRARGQRDFMKMLVAAGGAGSQPASASQADSWRFSTQPPDLAAEAHVETVPAVLAHNPGPAQPGPLGQAAPLGQAGRTARTLPAVKASVKRRVHHKVVHHVATHRRRRATKSA